RDLATLAAAFAAFAAPVCGQQPQEPGPPAPDGSDPLRRRLDAVEGQLRELEAARVRAQSGQDPHDYQPEKVPFAWGDFAWMPGGYAPADAPLKAGPFTGEVRVDAAYHWSFANPADHTISGSSEVFRHDELQLTQLGLGGDLYYKGVQARFMTQFGMYS